MLPKLVDNVPSKESINLANASNSKTSQDRSRFPNSSNHPKIDGRLCTYFHKTGNTIDVCYRKHSFPPSFRKKQVSKNATNADNGESQNRVSNGAEGSSSSQSIGITQEQ